jgi:hypothetical protein
MQSEINKRIYQLKIYLQDTKPSVWRRVLVKENTTMEQLHRIIQISMGWEDCHLYQFIIKGDVFGSAEIDYPGRKDNNAKLSSFKFNEKNKIIYEYDFGDNWQHIITVEKILAENNKLNYPSCIGGKLACPPEDCGGIYGYYDLLKALENKDHPEHEEMLEWIGEGFEPKNFDKDSVSEELRNI